jgi:hypothetical protein
VAGYGEAIASLPKEVGGQLGVLGLPHSVACQDAELFTTQRILAVTRLREERGRLFEIARQSATAAKMKRAEMGAPRHRATFTRLAVEFRRPGLIMRDLTAELEEEA